MGEHGLGGSAANSSRSNEPLTHCLPLIRSPPLTPCQPHAHNPAAPQLPPCSPFAHNRASHPLLDLCLPLARTPLAHLSPTPRSPLAHPSLTPRSPLAHSQAHPLLTPMLTPCSPLVCACKTVDSRLALTPCSPLACPSKITVGSRILLRMGIFVGMRFSKTLGGRLC